MKIIINGARGKMGKALQECATKDPNLKIIGLMGKGMNVSDKAIMDADVILDFRNHSATLPLIRYCAEDKKAVVIGTTGHDALEAAEIVAISKTIPIVWASNYSTGMNTMFWLVRKTAENLGPDYDLEIVEMHHRLKKDAPSGTAKKLAEILQQVRQTQRGLIPEFLCGRSGNVGERSVDEIGIHSVRGGDVFGDHTVMFAGNGDRVEITHRASSRETFARGALIAAKWIVGKPPGLYDMQDVLGLPK